MLCWSDIPEFPHSHYNVNIRLSHVEETLDRYNETHQLNLSPDFQRAHVWTEDQQVAYMEYLLMRPQAQQLIIFNHPNWMGNFKGEMLLLDGKQRLEAARRWLHNEIPAHGHYRKDFTHYDPKNPCRQPGAVPTDIDFVFCVMKIKTREEIIKWYVNFNAGGTPHTKEELDRVRLLLKNV